MTIKRATTLGTGLALAAALALASTTASAANPGKEAQTAATHAALAAKSTSLDMVKTHLHHVVNCLVGPKDPRFTTKEINPCQGMGRGAIPDAWTKASAKSMRNALRDAERGLKAKSLKTAQAEARKAGGVLTKVAAVYKTSATRKTAKAAPHKATPKKEMAPKS